MDFPSENSVNKNEIHTQKSCEDNGHQLNEGEDKGNMDDDGDIQGDALREYALNGCIENINEDEIPELVSNPEILRQFCEKLIRAFEPLERKEAAFEQLFQIVKKLSVRADYLQQLINSWLPHRQTLVCTMKEDTKTMNLMTKACNTGRLATSVIDSAGLVGGLIIGTSSKYSSLAFQTANICRMIGFAASAAELIYWKSKLERLMKLIQIDQASFAPIEAFFHQNSELEEAMKVVFPFEITNRMLKEFERAVHNDLSQSELLQVILGPLLMEDVHLLRNITLIRNLVAFTRCPAATNWCRWVILRHHKVSLDIETMLLQLINPQRFVSSQSVGMTAKGGEAPPPLSVLARIGLNCVTVYDAVQALKYGTMVEELKQLQNHLQLEMTTIVQISRLLQIRRSNS